MTNETVTTGPYRIILKIYTHARTLTADLDYLMLPQNPDMSRVIV
jgi:hypothetical protein